jgi:hypothetical protein
MANGSRKVLTTGDLDFALAQWRANKIAMHLRRTNPVRIIDLLKLFEACEIPVEPEIRRPHLVNQIRALVAFFEEHGDPEFSDPAPDVMAYLEWRGPSHLYHASGEIRLLSRVYSWTKSHTPIQLGECPWSSEPIVEALQAPMLKDLGTAMVFYGRHPGLDAHRNVGTANVAQMPICLAADPVTICEEWKLRALRDHSVRQLKRDGRPDLARALNKLTMDEVRIALVAGESATQVANAPQLVLGTQRAARIAALRHQVRVGPKGAMMGVEAATKIPTDG